MNSSKEKSNLERLLERTRRAGTLQLLASGRMSMAIPAIARITGVPDRLEIAEAAAESVLSEQSVTPLFAMYATAALALLAVQKGDQSAAEEHYAHLQGLRSMMLWTVSSVDRLLGLLSQTMGNLDQAAAHFEDTLTFCRKAGYRPELAWSCCDYANTLLQRASTGSAQAGRGDRAKAMSLLEESLTVSTELGMRPLMERVMERLERTRSLRHREPAYPNGLTQREVEVLRLVAAGKTDREIADELVIGVRTVTTHVSNILGKTGAANRTEAANYALRNQLV